MYHAEYVRTVPHGLEYFRDNLAFCDLVRFCFAAVVIDLNVFEREMIVLTLIELYMYTCM